MAVTIKDVARQANVSVRTVSRAINNQSGISTATRERIQGLARELGFRPSHLARALVTQRSHTIGVAIPHITNPFFAEVTQSIYDTGREAGYSVLLNLFYNNKKDELEGWNTLADHAVEGIITNIAYGDEAVVVEFTNTFRPVVVILKKIAGLGVSSVFANYLLGAALAVHYLAGKGHKKIILLAPIFNHPHFVQRVKGYRQAMVELGLEPIVHSLEPDFNNPDTPDGYRATQRLFEIHSDATAILAYNDLLAIGAIQACQKIRRRIPEDCAVIGFDDNAFASLVHPALTTIRVDKREIGRQAVVRLLDMLEKPDHVFDPIELDVDLIVRESA